VWKDSVPVSGLQDPSCTGDSPLRFRLDQAADYALTGSGFVFTNRAWGTDADYLTLFQRLDYRSQAVVGRNLLIGNRIVHELGVRYLPDSLAAFRPDETTLVTRLDAALCKRLSFSLSSNLVTRLFNDYAVEAGPGTTARKYLQAAFLTPLQGTFSTCVKWTHPAFGSLDLGLSAAKLTWVLNRRVYNRVGLNDFYGVPEGQRFRFEYGLSLQLVSDRLFFKRIQWNCDLVIFKNHHRPIDISLKNNIGVRIGKYLRGSLRTRLIYEKDISPKLQTENMLSVGLYVKL
jgi:hypothetical protein